MIINLQKNDLQHDRSRKKKYTLLRLEFQRCIGLSYYHYYLLILEEI